MMEDSSKNQSSDSMDVDFKTPGYSVITSDGDFGDDERTETDRSPVMPMDDLSIKDGAAVVDGDEDQHSSGGDDTLVGLNGRKKRHRRGKHKGGSKHAKKWRPYNKLSWEERRELDDIESKRATLKREERFLHGHPVAPYNTTQFLMDEHSKSENISPFVKGTVNEQFPVEDDFVATSPSAVVAEQQAIAAADDSLHSAENFENNDNDEDSFLRKDFSNTYENIHAERLQAMTKQELVQDYIELEIKVEKLEKRVRNMEEKQDKHMEITSQELKENVLFRSDNALLKLLREEIENLKHDNDKLRKDNLDLKRNQKNLFS